MTRFVTAIMMLSGFGSIHAQNVGIGELMPGAKLTIKTSDGIGKSLLIKTMENDTAFYISQKNHYINGYVSGFNSSLTVNNRYFLPFDDPQLTILASGERSGINANGSLSTIDFRNVHSVSTRYSLTSYTGNLTTHKLYFSYLNAGVAEPLLYFDFLGRAGIGNWAPAEKLDVTGNISSSGNIKATGEIQRPVTGTANLVPVAYGAIHSSGVIQSGTGNYTVERSAVGVYVITITGESYVYSSYSTSISPAGVVPLFASYTSGDSKLYVRTFNLAGTLTDVSFSFIVYQQ